jgi:hypothetical protein
MMDRRLFLKLTGFAAAATALPTMPVSAAPAPEGAPAGLLADPPLHARTAFRPTVTDTARVAVREPGTYQIYGRVRLQDSWVEISGLSQTQQVSWSGAAGDQQPVTSFTAFEHFERGALSTAIEVRGGRLESLRIVPIVVE